MRQQPYEAIRTALLTGIVVGATDLADAPTCEECQRAMDTIREGVERGAQMAGDAVRPRREAAQRPAQAK